jgi:hypothetical protein
MGKLWPGSPVAIADAPAQLRSAFPGAIGFLQHPRIAPITYPFEWPFNLLKRAALLHIDVHQEALRNGLTLSDGSAYNVQFVGSRPVFMDSLAFVPHVDGMPWAGYSQFCESFLNPLLLMASRSTVVHDIYRGRLSGVSTRETARQLGWWGALRARAFMHVTVNSWAESATSARPSAARTGLSKAGLDLLLGSLRRTIGALELPGDNRDWSRYETSNGYSDAERRTKALAVQSFIERTRPAMLLDVGCNAGEYSELALNSGAGSVVGIERDAGAVNRAVLRADSLSKPFLPLQVDIQNPGPSQGWNLAERLSFRDRVKPDALLCLALVHHLALGEGVPLGVILPAIIGLAPSGAIEFVPLDDPMARRIAGPVERMRHPYDLPTFLSELSKVATPCRQTTLTAGGRILIEYSSST